MIAASRGTLEATVRQQHITKIDKQIFNQMELFHVSCNEYKVGDICFVKEETPYFKAKKATGQEWVDLFLNCNKQEDAPFREFTLYAFDFIGNCSAFFGSRKCESGYPFYYKVEMENPVIAPMCLTDLITKEGKSSTKLNQISEEYWTPTLRWNFYEYLSNEMKILEILKPPTTIQTSAGKFKYGNDIELSKTFLNNIKTKIKCGFNPQLLPSFFL